MRPLVSLDQDLFEVWQGRAADGVGIRTFGCDGCGLVMDRDGNAAANLAAWAEAAELDVAQVPDRQAGGRVAHAPEGRRWPSLQRW